MIRASQNGKTANNRAGIAYGIVEALAGSMTSESKRTKPASAGFFVGTIFSTRTEHDRSPKYECTLEIIGFRIRLELGHRLGFF